MATPPDARTALATRADQQTSGNDAAPLNSGGHLVPAGAETSRIVLWAYEARQAHQIAQSLARSSFVPLSLRGKPDEITAAILTGGEMGLPIMAALRSIDIINGTPGFRAHMLRGLVQSRGHRIWLDEQSPTQATVSGQRREPDGSYGPVQTITWTIERAAQLGLTDKAEWKKQPATMLTNRATGDVARLVAADALFAMPYTAEELEEDQPAPLITPAAAALSRRAEAIEPPAALETPVSPVADPVLAAEEPAKPAAAKTPKQRKLARLHILRNELEGFAGSSDEARELFMVHIASIIGHEVASTKELTETELDLCIADLVRAKKEQDAQKQAEPSTIAQVVTEQAAALRTVTHETEEPPY